MVDPGKDVSASLIGHGRAYGVGAISGKAVFSIEEAIACAQTDMQQCILIVEDLVMNESGLAGLNAASGKTNSYHSRIL